MDFIGIVQAVVDDIGYIFNDFVVSFVKVLVQCLDLFHDVFNAPRQYLDGLIELALQLFGAHGIVNVGLNVIHTITLLHLDLIFHLMRHCRVLVERSRLLTTSKFYLCLSLVLLATASSCCSTTVTMILL